MNIELTEVVVALIGLLGAVITAYVVPLIKSKLSKEKQEELAKWVKIAVVAAEDLIKGTKLGQEKKEYVINYLSEIGIDVTDERIKMQIDILIDGTVGALNISKNK